MSREKTSGGIPSLAENPGQHQQENG